MIGLIKERIIREGHIVIFCKLEDKDFFRVSEVLKREDICARRLVGNFILLYPVWRTNTTVDEIMKKEKENLKKNMPSLFDGIDN